MLSSKTDVLVLGFPEYAEAAERLATALGVDYAQVEIHRFPDGESRVRLPANIPERLVLCRSLLHPNDKLIELLLTAGTARTAGAKHITLVAPYLCYMRQDIAFHPGEAVSQRIIGRWLASLFDTVITVDPHLHRVHTLTEAVPAARAIALSASASIGEFLRQRLQQPILVGPDSESRQWVETIARIAGLRHVIAEKQRLSDREVRIAFPASCDVRGQTVVLIDDMASTGNTLAVAASLLREAGAAKIYCCVIHPLFMGDAENKLRAAGITEIWSTDSVPHPTNAIPLTGLLATAFTA